jgi:ornithine carbamoyltransferase
MKDFVEIGDFTPPQLQDLLQRALADKKLFRAGKLPATCNRKVLVTIFEKQSLRTRVSFESAIAQLGGSAISLTGSDIGIGKREDTRDIARVLGRMCDAVAARTYSHQFVLDLAKLCAVPVINALTDFSHPCQAMADVMTAMEIFGPLAGRTLAFVGDGNNVARSLAILCGKLGINMTLACPPGYELAKDFLAALAALKLAGRFTQTNDAASAVAGAAVIYTDTWISMGQEAQREARVQAFKDYQINAPLMAKCPKDAVVMHCLPAYRGYEITDEVMEAHAQTIFEQAENRLHFQRTLLNVLIAEGGVK